MGLKPMNCPAHCLVYKHNTRSYRDLPIRVADFSTLHRNEVSGSLGGLTRLRQFHQDDAHIFCRQDQIESEISACLEFVRDVYGIFGFDEPEFRLSTRPEEYVGHSEDWDHAEDSLRKALDRANTSWILNPGDGAFYGPKIDVAVTDALKRRHQCATIQLDFQLPKRFELSYKTSSDVIKDERPVIIHRAVLGSLERFMALLIEHTAGRWPMWLSPRQFMVVPVSEESHGTYAFDVAEKLKRNGFAADCDRSSETLNKRIRNAQLNQYNYILVVGNDEIENGEVNVRTREGKVQGKKSLESVLNDAREECDNISRI